MAHDSISIGNAKGRELWGQGLLVHIFNQDLYLIPVCEDGCQFPVLLASSSGAISDVYCRSVIADGQLIAEKQ